VIQLNRDNDTRPRNRRRERMANLSRWDFLKM
jgi:hypothetical protein